MADTESNTESNTESDGTAEVPGRNSSQEEKALADMACIPCAGGVPPLTAEQIAGLLPRLAGWEAVDNHHLSKAYAFKNFAEALAFVNRVGELAESVGHHPDLHLSWGRVGVEIWTHKINGLSESDFVFCAKCDRLFN